VAERHRDFERLLTFVDAVVAIAITLLVLPLAEAGSEVGDATALELLRAHSDDLLGFGLSFVVIARLWLGQHRIVSGVVRQTPAMEWLLLAWTFTIVFLPFPTSLVATTDHDPSAKVLYVGTMAVSSFMLTAIAWVITHNVDVLDTEEVPNIGRSAGVGVGFLVALAVMLAFPEFSYWPLLLLALVDPVVGLLQRVLART
jgi:TMEM175 potassium channel family protein